jgi:hypothetical protein
MAKQSLFDPEPDDEPAVPDVPRLRKVPGKVTDTGLYIIEQAMMLKAAVLARMDCAPDGADEEQGSLLVMICREWLTAESARLSGKGQP